MDVIAPLSRHVVAPLWARWESSAHLHHFRVLSKTQYDPVEVIRQRQLDALRAITAHACTQVPFWEKRFAAAGLGPESVNAFEDLQNLPLMTKSDLRDQGEMLFARNFSKAELHEFTTSGSTGVSVSVYRDEPCQQIKRGATLRSDEWTGWRLGERVASIWGNPQIRQDWKGRIRRALLERNYVYLDTLEMDEEAMRDFADTLTRKPPALLFGHAHSLYLFADFLRSRPAARQIRPKAVLSTCMVLHDFERKLISSIFACPVINRYGCEEVSLIACECRKGEGLHVNADCLYVELLDEQNNPCEPDQPGRVVVTDLYNRAMPIIRYEVGDMATWSVQPCSCGRTLPLLKSIEGRIADYVVTEDRKYISGISLTENFAVKIPGVAQVQIIQEEVNRFTFNLVKGPDYSTESTTVLERLVHKYFGSQVSYSIVFLEKIPQEPSGKYRFCISKVGHRFAE